MRFVFAIIGFSFLTDFSFSIIQSIRDTAADYPVGYDASEDLHGKSSRKDHHDSAGDVRPSRRPVPPSSTQVRFYYIQRQVW